MRITNKKAATVFVVSSNEHHGEPVKVVGVYATQEAAQKEYDKRFPDMCSRWLSLSIKEMELKS